MAAKDCKGSCGSLVQGTKGVIRTGLQPSLVGEVRLELYDGTVETYDDGSARYRALREFQVFVDTVIRQDYDFCYDLLEKSLAVAQVMTQARIQAGICFPCDEL